MTHVEFNGENPNLGLNSRGDDLGALEDRKVEVVSSNNKRKGVICLIAGIALVLLAIGTICFLNLYIPAGFVWPGVTKLLVAAGIAITGVGGIFFIGEAETYFRRAKAEKDMLHNPSCRVQ